MWTKILSLIAAILLIAFLVNTIKKQPQLFQKEALSKSFYVMGILGILLILFVAFCIFLLRMH